MMWRKETIEKLKEKKSEFCDTPAEIEKFDYLENLGFPGKFPFTRGIHPSGYRSRLWVMRQYAGYGTAEDANRRYKFLLSQGQTGLSVAFDLPTQLGYDSDHPLADGEVGRVGVAIDSLYDFELLFDGIPLSRANTSMTINSTAAMVLAMYVAVAEKQGASMEKLAGTLQNDPLKEYIARGTYIFPPAEALYLVSDILRFSLKNIPRWNPISICGYHMREAGCTASQEIAFTLANGIAYAESAMKAGLPIDSFAPRFSFFFSVYNDFCEEIAKFRAGRRVWAKFMKELGGKDPRSMQFRFGVQTSGVSLTAQQPFNNIIRSTLQALAAVLGGAQSIACACMDEALALPSERAARIALRTQQIIAYESGVTSTVDPCGGSFHIEKLTDEMEEEVMEYMERIRKDGNGSMLDGVIKWIQKGVFQKEIADSAYAYQKEIEEGKRILVGVNKFRSDEPCRIELIKIDKGVQENQIRKLREMKERRDGKKVENSLSKLSSAAEDKDFLLPFVIDAVKNDVTIGEICDVLRNIFGKYKPPEVY
jgi:methylmalonyl-CoA mutase N-terminal domain/subunit